jgi:hypothetical protein
VKQGKKLMMDIKLVDGVLTVNGIIVSMKK